MTAHLPTVETDDPAEGGGPVKTLVKGLAVLELIMSRNSVRTTDVAEHFSIDKGTASRILHTLADCGFAWRGAGRAYVIGPKLVKAMAQKRPAVAIRPTARPLLEDLVARTGESAHLAILADHQVLYLDRADSTAPLRVDRPAGTLAPLHCTALGKIFLAFADVSLPESLPPFTMRTLTDRDSLAANVRKVVTQGFAVDDEEFSLGIRCVAAPLRDAAGNVVAALGLSGPTPRVDLQRMHELAELVRETAGRFEIA